MSGRGDRGRPRDTFAAEAYHAMSDLHEYFIEETNKRLERIEDKLDTLLEFKWQIIGGSLVVSGLVAVAIQYIMQR